MANREELAEFVACSQKHITGDEKGQAQIFLDRLFQSFGQRGCLDVGGTASPGVQHEYPDAEKLVTEDCIRPVGLAEDGQSAD